MRNYIHPTVLLLILCCPVCSIPVTKDQPPQQLRSAQCEICTFMANMLHNLWGEKTLNECMGELIDYMCREMKVADATVCRGLTTEFKDEFIWVAGQIIVAPQQICGYLVKDCGHAFDPFNVTWNAEIPGNKPQPQPVKPRQPNAPTLNVLHLTDIHIDWKYQEGLESQCSEPQCCRPMVNGSGTITHPAGRWGTYGKCDAPYELFLSALDHIRETHTNLDYVIISGDLESHADWEYTKQGHINTIKNITTTIKSYLPGVPLYFSLGNHESVPHDNYAPRFAPKEYQLDWLYDTMADVWGEFMDKDQFETLKYRGCFMKRLFPGLRLISLNNAMDDQMNFYMYVNQTDPDGSLQWLIEQLLDAEKSGDKVHITAHIPGSAGDALEGWALNYYKVINRFESTVIAQFFGHTHSEQFYMMYEDPFDAHSKPTAVVYSAPSITPNSAYNPAYRIYKIDGNYAGSSFQVLDWEEWRLDIVKANQNPDSKPAWEVLYQSVLKEYNMASLLPNEWNNVIDRMGSDINLATSYHRNFFRRDGMGHCDPRCAKGLQCAARKMHLSDKLCEDLKMSSSINVKGPNSMKMDQTAEIDFEEIARRVKAFVESSDCPI